MRLENYVIGILMFSLIIVVFMGATVSIVDNYADMGVTVDIDRTSGTAFDKSQEVNEKVESMEEAVTGSDVGTSSSSTTFLGGIWGSLVILFKSVGISTSLIQEVTSLFGLPGVIETFLITVTVLTVMFAIIYLIYNYSGGT